MIQTPIRILFVCLGNICRSPSAEGVARQAADKAGYAAAFRFDSAGVGNWHIGAPPDSRAQAAAARYGIDLSTLRARQLRDADFYEFDLILAMDRMNLRDIQRRAPRDGADIKLLLEFAPSLGVHEVPDPYYGGAEGFETTLKLLDQAIDGLLRHYFP